MEAKKKRARGFVGAAAERPSDYGAAKAAEIRADYLARAERRKPLEAQWRLNLSFVTGDHYRYIAGTGQIEEDGAEYFWQERGVFNHVAPIFETRLAKLGRVRPKMSVRPSSADEEDIRTGKLSGKILDSACKNLELDRVIDRATMWSELCGTSFYKITWDQNAGAPVGTIDGKTVYEGEARADVCPPYEIYPSSLSADLSECESVIHAKAVPTEEVFRVYGTEVAAEPVEVFADPSVQTGADADGCCLVIERYVRPSDELPEGEFSVCAGDVLLYEGPLPYRNGRFAESDFPFIGQDAIKRPGGFFGQSVIERVIPIQRAYNALKNRKHEFLNCIAMGVLAVEDGSVDTDNLETEGLSPGKILVYRPGSSPPRLLDAGRVPADFREEEDRLLSEFVAISGVSELMRSSQPPSSAFSGAAIQLLIEQDDTRLSVTAGYIKSAIREAARQVLRLYKQFAGAGRLSRVTGEGGEVELIYWSKSDITCDDVVFDTENDISATPAVKQSMLFDLVRMGLLHDENGKLSDAARFKLLDSLGYGGWEFTRDLESLNVSRAQKENLTLAAKPPEPLEIDRHDLHLAEHTKYALSPEFEKLCAKKPMLKERLLEHIRAHKRMDRLGKEAVRTTDN